MLEQWGGRVVMGKEELNANSRRTNRHDEGPQLPAALGNDDRAPIPEQVDQHEAELKKHGKTYEFHRYDGAGHGFFLAPAALSTRAGNGWLERFRLLRQVSGEVGGPNMCTSIIEIVRAEGMAKRGDEWFPLSQTVVAYDHARHAPLGDVITLDFINADLDPGALAGIELTLETAKELRAALGRAIAAAEFEEAEVRGKGVVLSTA